MINSASENRAASIPYGMLAAIQFYKLQNIGSEEDCYSEEDEVELPASVVVGPEGDMPLRNFKVDCTDHHCCEEKPRHLWLEGKEYSESSHNFYNSENSYCICRPTQACCHLSRFLDLRIAVVDKDDCYCCAKNEESPHTVLSKRS